MVRIFLIITICLTLFTPFVSSADEKLLISVTPAEPFVIQHDDGSYSGITIDLWERIASARGYEYEYINMPLNTSLEQIYNNRVDVVLGAMSITKEREERLDFTHSFFNSGLGIITKRHTEYGIVDLFLDWSFWKSILMLIAFIFAGGLLIIVFENGAKNQDFAYNKVGNGVWWSIVTITTTGYGDLVPKTNFGRIFASVWMIIGAILAPSLIGNLAANMTIEKQNTVISNRNDLVNHTIGVISNTSTIEYFKRNQIPYVEVENINHLISLLRSGEIDGGVYDAPMLQYHARKYPDLTVLSDIFDRQNYGIALQSKSDLREDINAQLLTETNRFEWPTTLNRYLGD